jgi:FixJ family two-component response regulator
VDDDHALLSAMSRLVRSLGYEALAFSDAKSFLGSTEIAGVDCLVTDIQMPGMNGLDLLREMTGRSPPLSVIVMTAYPQQRSREEAIAGGALAFLEKPVSASVLEGCLSEATRRTAGF